VQDDGGLLRRIQNIEALHTCLDLLDEMKGNIFPNGFDLEEDKQILTILCGHVESKPGEIHFLRNTWIGTRSRTFPITFGRNWSYRLLRNASRIFWRKLTQR
jgi:hypothetical protein